MQEEGVNAVEVELLIVPGCPAERVEQLLTKCKPSGLQNLYAKLIL